jgi:hypothetical protein
MVASVMHLGNIDFEADPCKESSSRVVASNVGDNVECKEGGKPRTRTLTLILSLTRGTLQPPLHLMPCSPMVV